MEEIDYETPSEGICVVTSTLERKCEVQFRIHKKLDVSELLKYLKCNPHIDGLYIRYIELSGEESTKSCSMLTLDSIPCIAADANGFITDAADIMTNAADIITDAADIITDADDGSAKCLSQPTNLALLSLWGDFVNDEFVKRLCDTNYFHNIKSLELSNNSIGDLSASALAESHNFPNLAHLILHETNIGLEGVRTLALSCNLKILQTVDFDGSCMDSCESVEELSRITYSITRPIFKLRDMLDVFYGYLRKVLSNKMSIDEMLDGGLSSLVKFDKDASCLKYFLAQDEKYQLRLNRVLKKSVSGTFYHFLSQPYAEVFLFENGALPATISEAKMMSQERELQVITEDSQSVHITPVTKKNIFYIKYLVESVNTSTEHMKRTVNSFLMNISDLLYRYKNDPIRLKLLNLTDIEKIRVVEYSNLRGSPFPSDKEFIETIILTIKGILDEISNGIGKDFFNTRVWYNYNARDTTISIYECISYIKSFIDIFPIPLTEKVELLVTVMEQNPNQVKDKLKKENLHRPEIYEWVKDMTNDDIGQLFRTVCDLDIDQIWREHKEFVLLKQIFISATAYDGGYTCTQGVWSHIVGSLDEIDFELLDRYGQHLDRERDRERLMPTISRNNSIRLADYIAHKLIEYAAFRPKARTSLEELVFGLFDMRNCENITFEQQKILVQLHCEFTCNVRKFLPNYERDVPTPEEYDVLIENLLKSKPLQDFIC